jgi:outer membrane protein OmpA-like peptidoglycan-associated protein
MTFTRTLYAWALVLGCSCLTLSAWAQTGAAKYKPVPGQVNSEHIELCPRFSSNGQVLYFVRIGDPENADGGAGATDIWYSKKEGAAWGKPAKLHAGFGRGENVNNAVQGISLKGDTLILLNRYYEDGYGKQDQGFSYSVWQDSLWSFPQALSVPGFYNASEYATLYIAPNQKLAIVEVQNEAGAGAQDLFVITRDSLHLPWSELKPLTGINTEFDEISPYLSKDGTKLFFSSDREGGLGGFDVYVSYRLGDDYTAWSEPVNLGSQLNGGGFEAYFVLSPDEKDAYFVKRDETTQQNDIYTIRMSDLVLPKPGVGGSPFAQKVDRPDVTPPGEDKLPGKPVNPNDPGKPQQPVQEEPKPEPVSYVTLNGVVYDAQTRRPIPGAKIAFKSLDGSADVGSVESDAYGNYTINLKADHRYEFTAEAKEYLGTTDEIALTKDLVGQVIRRNIYLSPMPASTRLDNVYFDFDSHKLRQESYKQLNELSSYLNQNPEKDVELSGHTDSIGPDAYNQKLSEARANSVKTYLVVKGANRNRLNAVGYGETRPVAPNTTPEGRQLNRRVEFKLLYK